MLLCPHRRPFKHTNTHTNTHAHTHTHKQMFTHSHPLEAPQVTLSGRGTVSLTQQTENSFKNSQIHTHTHTPHYTCMHEHTNMHTHENTDTSTYPYIIEKTEKQRKMGSEVGRWLQICKSS